MTKIGCQRQEKQTTICASDRSAACMDGETMIEKHFQAKELVALLSWSKNRVSRNFKFHPRTLRDGKRFFVPESVVKEVLEKLRINSRPMNVRRGRPPHTG